MDLPEIHEISKLRLEPGDILIVRNTEIELNSKMEDEISRRVRELLRLSRDFPILVLGRDWVIGVTSIYRTAYLRQHRLHHGRVLMICGEGIIDGLEITADEIQAVLAAEVLAIRADQAQGILTGWGLHADLVHDVLSRTTVPGYWLRAVPWREGEGAG